MHRPRPTQKTSRRLRPLFKSHPLVDSIAFCHLNPTSLARFVIDPIYADKFDPRDAYASFDDILRADIDALAIITQPDLHAPQCIAVMEAMAHKSALKDGEWLKVPDWGNAPVWSRRSTPLHHAART